LTTTFDTNTLDSVVWPETAQRKNKEAASVVRAAIEDGRVRGFFSETVITLEGIHRDDRSEILGKTRVVIEASANGENHHGRSVDFKFSVGSKHIRKPLHGKSLERVQKALELGMLPLQTVALFTRYHDDRFPLFRPPGGHTELLRCMDKVNALTIEIMKRGLGQAVARDLGLQLSERRDDLAQPELWHQGLGRARGKTELKKVARATREWADGDSVGAHHGFGIQLFCTEDQGRSGRSVLGHDSRKWLNEEFGIEFVTLAELAERVAP
jgi:hypothetical protein